MRKKLLIYTMIMTRGGSERMIAELANYLISDYDITIVTNIKHACEYALNTNIKYRSIDRIDKKEEKFCLKVFTKLSLKRSRILKQIIKKEKPDIILAFLPEPTIRMLSLKKAFPNIKMIFSIRNHPKREFIYPFSKQIRNHYYKKADKVIIQDEAYRKYLKKVSPNKITVIPNFLSRDFINIKKENKKEKKIVSVARFEKQKNLDLLIKAFKGLDQKFEDYKLYLYGNGKQKKHLEKLVQKLKLENRVFLIENKKNIPEEIKNSSLFVLPSNYEGMPNALLEAMSLSLPVISTDSTEVIHHIIQNNINGIIVEKENLKMLIQKMQYVLDHPKVSKKMALEAKKIKEKYNNAEIILKWQDVLER